MPVAPNSNPDGSDNPDGRQLNRRVEFKILKD
jgi:outer membrane protein OmpA-like peptidoglycan-associated protein